MGIIYMTDTCILRVGPYCMDSLNGLSTFMQTIVDLNLDSHETEQCCYGEVLPGSCECKEKAIEQDKTKTCIFDYCLEPMELLTGLTGYFEGGSTGTDWTLIQKLIGMAMHLWGYVGTGNSLNEAAPGFVSKMGQLTSVGSGLFASLWLGQKITAKSITPYYIGAARSNAYEYSGAGIFGDLLGVFDAFWAIAYTVMAAVLFAFPIENAYYMNAQEEANGFTDLYYGIIQAFGIFIAFLMLE